ncbi:HD domain-containing phosphohydrolase [Litoribacillus peritrichatus]|uniref:Metal-dependent phosphohydrolase n=1 Tax=Litoribacillus peritrichatus TaxID=718191 RepID=A0ABP7MA34_9GAMM
MLHKRFSIKIHITTLFISLIFAVGGVLAWFNYLKISDLLISASDKMFRQIATEVSLDFKATYLPAASNVQLIANTDLPLLTTKEARFRKIPMMVSMLRTSTQIAAIEVGYPDGDYFIVRAISSDYMVSKFDAPPQSSYMVDHIDYHPSDGVIERTFLSQSGDVISEETQIPTDYDPRGRPWFLEAVNSEQLVTTPPYLFFFIGKLGVTLSYQNQQSGAVVAADITLEQLSDTLSKHYITPSSTIVMTDKSHQIVAHRDRDLIVDLSSGTPERIHADQLNKPVVNYFLTTPSPNNHSYDFQGQSWIGTTIPMKLSAGNIALTIVSPKNELLAEAIEIRNSSTLIAAIILLLSLPMTWLLANRVAKPLIDLTKETTSIKELDFRESPNTRSFVLEIDYLSKSINSMKSTINQFLTLISSVTSEKDHERLLNIVTAETRKASTAKSVTLYLFDEQKQTLNQASFSSEHQTILNKGPLKKYRLDQLPDFIQTAIHNKETQQQLHEITTGSKVSHLDDLLLDSELTTANVVAIPLLDRKKNVIGMLLLTFDVAPDNVLSNNVLSDNLLSNSNKIGFAEILSGFCAESLEKNQLYIEQKALLESFIKLIAGAIDAKSPYTGGHCQRVPELAKLLAQAACDSNEIPFKDFSMNAKEWEELHIASWLHDCGKVTTPEHVVDKSTRLETLYNRIHEIRTRFEVLKRDEEIAFLANKLNLLEQNTTSDEQLNALAETFHNNIQQLNDDFYFIAHCNSGDNPIKQEEQARLNQIAERTWQRTLSNQVGLAWEERKRMQNQEEVLPVTENILSDKPEHLIARESNKSFSKDNPWGFDMQVPEHELNLGEIYNLSIANGTLTTEERFIINDHIVQTIIMLEKLPFPKHLKNVPEIAGSHHEKINGTGYPRKLTRQDMSIPARIMAIADIFEALTASDRPYKDPKSLGSALKIMRFMVKDGHIDKDLFELFLNSGAYAEYAQKHLTPTQRDEIDIEEFLEP